MIDTLTLSATEDDATQPSPDYLKSSGFGTAEYKYEDFRACLSAAISEITVGINISINLSATTETFHAPVSGEQSEYERQKSAFNQIPPLFLSQYNGKYVVSHDGVIMDSDEDLYSLTNRFFSAHNNMKVYISFVGSNHERRIRTPFRRRK